MIFGLLFGARGRRSIDTQKDTQFSDAWIVLAILLTLLGLAFDNAFLTAAALTLALIPGLGWLWAQTAPRGLLYRRKFGERRAFQGETIELSLEVANRKWVPLTWLTIRDFFPPELPVEEIVLDVNPATNLAEFATFWMVGPFQRINRHFHVTCTVRGFHRYGPATLITGDGFGFFTRSGEAAGEEFLIVYPRIYTVAEMRLPTKNPFGETRVERSLFEDPLRTSGIRDWQPSDAPRRVHWKATARHSRMLSRIYESSEEHLVQLFLNVATLERHWHGYIPELQERAIGVAGSLAGMALEQRMSVGLIANGTLPNSDQPLRLLPGRSPNQLMHILEMLAAVSPFATKAIEELILGEAPTLPWGATLVVVTAIAHEALLATLIDLAAVGRRIVLVTLAEEPPRRYLGNITVYHLPHLIDDLIAPVPIADEELEEESLARMPA